MMAKMTMRDKALQYTMNTKRIKELEQENERLKNELERVSDIVDKLAYCCIIRQAIARDELIERYGRKPKNWRKEQ